VEHEAKQHPTKQVAKGRVVEADDIITIVARIKEDGEVQKGLEDKTSLIVGVEEGILGVAARRRNPTVCVCLALVFMGDRIPYPNPTSD
jgi:hypothetical protein